MCDPVREFEPRDGFNDGTDLLGFYTRNLREELETAPVRQPLELTNVDDLKARPGGDRTGGRTSDDSHYICRSDFPRFVRSGAVQFDGV